MTASACADDDAKPAAGSTAAAEPDPQTFKKQAHADALADALPIAQRAFALHDPVSATALGLPGVPRIPPVAPGRTGPMLKEADAAWTAAKGIDGRLLGAAPEVLVLTLRFALSRARDNALRRRPWRGDPGWFVVEADRVLQRVEADAADGTCETCPEALAHLAADIDQAMRHLGAASVPATAAARVDVDVLSRRVARLPGAEPAIAGLTRAAQHLDAVAQALPAAAPASYDKAIPSAKAAAAVARLPPRLTAKDLRRKLEVAEDQDEAPSKLFTALGPTLGRLQAMVQQREGKATKSEAVSVDAARCEAAWKPIAAFAKTNPELAPAQLDCANAVRRLGGQRLDDAELTVALVDLGVVDPVRTARRAQESRVLALIAGRIAPVSQRHSVRVALLAGLRDDAAALVALEEARTAACLAATSLWIHGGIGSDEDLAKRLQERCAFRKPTDWIADAEARPMRALHGLALMRLGTGPAEIVPLDRYWWAPSGLLGVLAQPALVRDLPLKSNVDVKVEPLR